MNTFCYDKLAGRIPLYRELLLGVPQEVKEQAFDIHLKVKQPVSICGKDGVFFLRPSGGVTRAFMEDLTCVSREEIQEIFTSICSHSVFSHEREIQQGYVLTADSGRVGVCGTAVLENGRIKSVRDVTSLVFRISREIPGCGDRLFLEGVELSRGLLIAGEPSSGKTTLLRDIAHSLSVGKFQPVRRVAVVDERGEIGGDFDLGPCADILKGYPKAEAFDVALRMLSPEFIVCDELSANDLEAVRQSVFAGVPLIASVHTGKEEKARRPLYKSLLETGAFGTTAYLSGRSQPGEIELLEQGRKGQGTEESENASRTVRISA